MNDELMAEAIANYVTVNGASYTDNGSYIAYASELAEHFGVTEQWIEEHAQDIKDYFDPEILSEYDIYRYQGNPKEDLVIDLMFFGNYCNVDMEEEND